MACRDPPAHEIAFWRLEAAWRQADRLGMLQPQDKETRVSRNLFSVPFGKSVAAFGMAAVLAGIAIAYSVGGSREQSFSTPVGGHESVTLVDGSQVELNTDTVLGIADGAHDRTVWLDKGEAYFQVRHDASRPFVVRIGSHRVTDIGTEFTVRRGDDNVEVMLLAGRASFETSNIWDKSKTTLLSSGDLAIANAQGLSVTRKSAKTFAHELAWRSGRLVFDHISLADAAAELNRYNRNRIVITDAAASAMTIDGTFPLDGVDKFAHAAKEVFGLHVEQLGDETVISR